MTLNMEMNQLKHSGKSGFWDNEQIKIFNRILLNKFKVFDSDFGGRNQASCYGQMKALKIEIIQDYWPFYQDSDARNETKKFWMEYARAS